DAARGEFLGQAHGEGVGGGLHGGVVHVLPRAAEGRGGGGHVDDGAAVGEAAGGLLGAEDVPDEVDVDDVAQVVDAQLGERADEAGDAGVVDQAGERAELRGGVEQGGDLVGV